ncbi:MAG: carboxypeptidase-like regulatory domain-containing protein [Gemmatimonadaceae bacterium]|nr:carboxypeptidase-like regulatory domain-containing protein [Gemmatimonadaceae bacterium]
MSAHDDEMITPRDDAAAAELVPTFTGDGHVDEGTIHAWIDGAFNVPASATVEAHVSTCSVCQGQVAEARGFIAGASRVVRGLDAVPADVVSREDVARTASRIVAAAADHTRVDVVSARSRRAWYGQTAFRAAAALLITVGGGAYVWSGLGNEVAMPVVADSTRMRSSAPQAAGVSAPVVTERRVEAAAPAAMDAATANRASPSLPPVALRDRARDKPVTAETDPALRERRVNVATEVAAMPARAYAPASPPLSTASNAVPSVQPPVAVGGVGGRGVAGGVAKSAVRDQLGGGMVSGVVVDPRNTPLAGAAVIISGTTIGTTTNARGEFDLRAPADTATLQVRRLGYTTSSLALSTRSMDTTRTRVTLREANQAPGAVVVASEAAPVRQEVARPGAICWEVLANGPSRSTRPVGSFPRAIQSDDFLSSSPVSAALVGWPSPTERTLSLWERDARGSVTATAITNDARLTLRLSLRGQFWEGTATQVREGAMSEHRIRLAPADAMMCKP